MKKISYFLIFILFFSFFVTTNVHALSCAQPPSIEDAFHDYDAVFSGRVIDTEGKNNYKLVSVEVTKSFKGIEKELLDFREDITWGESQIGEEYLFFLNKENLHFISPLCSPTISTTQVDMANLTFNDVPSPNVDQLKGEDTPQGVHYTEEIDKEDTETSTHSSSSGSFDEEKVEKENEKQQEKSEKEKQSVIFGLSIMVMILVCVIFFIILADVSSKK